MKLLLQLIFAQGWLWRDRFPEVLARADGPKPKLAFVILPALFILLGTWLMVEATWDRGIPLFMLGITWLLWALSPMGIEWNTRWKELQTSASWAIGLLFLLTLLASIGAAVVTQDWIILIGQCLLLSYFGPTWTRGIEERYLFFRDPGENAWRLRGRPAERGLIRPLITLWVETVWRLPREILFRQGERHAP